jgi:AsmA protein
VKITRWVLGGVIGLVGLVLLAVVTLTLLINPSRFRGQIESAVQDATGRPFAIRGDLDIAWFPWLAVRTGAAELGNPPLAQWQSARVGVRLLPLIKGQMVIDRVRFEGLQVQLKRTADGQTNWDGLFAARKKAGARDRPLPQIGGVEIRDGALDYIDEQSGAHYRITGWKLDAGAWKAGTSVPVSTTLTLESVPPESKGSFSATLEFESRLEVSANMDRLEARGTELSGQVRGGALLKKGAAFATELPVLSVTFTPLSVAAPEWQLKLVDAQLAGSLTAEKTANQIRARGPLSVRISSIRAFLADLGIDAPVPHDSKAMGPLTLNTSWTFIDGAIALKPIALQLDETTFKGEIIRSAGTEPTWTFDLRGDRIDLGRYLITEDTSDKPFELPVEALRALHAQGTLTFDQATFAHAQMKNARLRVLMADGQLRTTSTLPAAGPQP